MKTVDFNRKFKDYRGVEAGEETVAEVLSKVLFNAGIPELPIEREDKFRAYKLSTKLISQNGIIEISEDDEAFLKTFCVTAFTTGAYGQIMDLLKQ